jgi:PD-(D/E)XK nuclease superfamily
MAKRNLPVVPPDLIDDKLPNGTFSHSQYSRYKTCPKSYEFRYVEGRVLPPGVAAFRGTSVHAGVEAAHKHLIETKAPPLLEQMRAVVSDAFDEGKAEVLDWDGEQPGTVKDLSLKLYDRYHHDNLPQLRPVAAEEGFAVRIGTVPVVGFIDLVERHAGFAAPKPDDPLIVVDLKTSASKWSASDVEKDTQTTLYSIVKNTFAARIDNLVMLKAGPALHRLETPRTATQKRIVIEDLEETVDLVKRGIFPKTSIDSWACSEKWCGYWSLCRGRKY